MRTKELIMDFSVEKENKAIKVSRAFVGHLSRVWAAWTDSRFLDQWWAPKPWQAETGKMEFREGGYWLYRMIGPEGNDEQWCRADFKLIDPLKQFTVEEGFCDKQGNINTDFPIAIWNVSFIEMGDATMVDIKITFNSSADMDKYLELGFREGFTAALENLDEFLEKKS